MINLKKSTASAFIAQLSPSEPVSDCATSQPVKSEIILLDPLTLAVLWRTSTKADGTFVIRGLELNKSYLPFAVSFDRNKAAVDNPQAPVDVL